jgi:hypothetical protein
VSLFKLVPYKGTIKFADDVASVDTAPDFQCQLTHAQAVPATTFSTIPQTGCAGPSNTYAGTSWALNLAWVQDWTAPGGGLAKYALDNAGETKYFEYVPTSDTEVAISGQVEIVPVAFGGDMGVVAIAGPVDWNMPADPVITVPAALPLAAGADV